MSGGARPSADVPTGNTFDKYGSSNPVVKRLMAGFHADARRALGAGRARARCSTWAAARACSPLEWAERLGDGRIVGIDLDDPKLRAEWEKRARPNLEFRVGGGHARSRSPTTSSTSPRAIEVLEHVPEPEATLAEMARVARGHLLVSVPREPLWRGLNMARGAYLARPRQHARAT